MVKRNLIWDIVADLLLFYAIVKIIVPLMHWFFTEPGVVPVLLLIAAAIAIGRHGIAGKRKKESEGDEETGLY